MMYTLQKLNFNSQETLLFQRKDKLTSLAGQVSYFLCEKFSVQTIQNAALWSTMPGLNIMIYFSNVNMLIPSLGLGLGYLYFVSPQIINTTSNEQKTKRKNREKDKRD